MNENQWMPIETAPRDGQWILLFGVCDSESAYRHIGFWSKRHEDWFDVRASFSEPTHWMPLPPPPTA